MRSLLDVGRVRPVVLFDAWLFAEADATLALAAWRSAARNDKAAAYATYRAALTVRPRRPGCSRCGSRPPEPDLDSRRKKRARPRSPPPRQRLRRSGTGRRGRAERPVRPAAARCACRAEPRPAPASLDAAKPPVSRVGPSRAAHIRCGKRAP